MTNEPTTEQRILTGVQKVFRQLEDLTGRVDVVAGDVARQREQIGELLANMPEQVRFCPSESLGEDGAFCHGGYKLMRSKQAEGNPRAKEWAHPLPKDQYYQYTSVTGAVGTATWHSVYNSKALDAPPDGEERPWPSTEEGGSHLVEEAAAAGATHIPDDQPF